MRQQQRTKTNDLTRKFPRHLMPPPDSVPRYDSNLVQEYWEDCIRYDTLFLDPYICHNYESYENSLNVMHSEITKKKVLARQGKFCVLPSLNFTAFRSVPFVDQQRMEKMFRFEGRMFRVKLRLCRRCRQCCLNLSVTDGGNKNFAAAQSA